MGNQKKKKTIRYFLCSGTVRAERGEKSLQERKAFSSLCCLVQQKQTDE